MPTAELFENVSPAIAEALKAMGVKSAVDGGLLFCACNSEAFAINGVTYQWPRNSKLKWSMGFSRLGTLTDLDLKGMYTDNFAEIARNCNLQFEYTPNVASANISTELAMMDGPGGVLADMQIPMQQTQRVNGRIDQLDVWTIAEDATKTDKIDAKRVTLHELLHACGLGHAPVIRDNPALIEPTYNRQIGHLQPRDIAELQRRYGPAIVEPGAPQTPTDNNVSVEIVVRTADKVVKFSGSKAWANL